METLLVRLKALEPRRGHVLRRYTYAGITFHEERGWYRVEPALAEYLRTVRQVATEPFSPLAFDVATDEQAKALEAGDAENSRRRSTDDVPVVTARAAGAPTVSEDAPKVDDKDPRRKRDKE